MGWGEGILRIRGLKTTWDARGPSSGPGGSEARARLCRDEAQPLSLTQASQALHLLERSCLCLIRATRVALPRYTLSLDAEARTLPVWW